MSNKNEFLAKQDTLSAIPDSAINTVKRMPIAIYIHEAEALAKWCRDDRAAFKTIGGLWKLVTDIPIRAGALRELESMWRNERNTPDAASLRWKEESPALWEMRKNLIQAFRYAFRENKVLLRRVSAVAKGNTNAERLQSLNDLAVLGRANSGLLTDINFDLAKLDEASAKSAEMSEVLAAATSGRKKGSETLKLRDKAYSHLKEAVDEVYCAGRYLMRHNSDRRKGYSSDYLNKDRNKQLNPTETATPPTVETTAEPILEPKMAGAVEPIRESAMATTEPPQWNQPWNRQGTGSDAGPPIERVAATAA